jgi:hypothetical protein
MTTRVGTVFFLSATLLLTGCVRIPKNASLLSAKVSEGVTRVQTEHEKVIVALANVERGVLDEQWDKIYAKVESGYMQRNSLSDASRMSQDDRRKIAANAAKVRENILSDIAAKEQELKDASRKNSDVVVQINEVVRRYLLSLEKWEEAREKIEGLFKSITGVDFSKIQGVAMDKIKNITSIMGGQ